MSNRPELPYYSELPGFELQYHHDGDAGLDLPIWDERLTNGEYSTSSKIVLGHMGAVTLKTGVHMAIPDTHYGELDSRSGTSKKRLDLLCRTIDSPFRGNIRLAIINLNKEPVTISNGDELFQIVIKKYRKVVPVQFNSLDAFMEYAGETKRGADGFGSKERNKEEE